MSKSKEMSASTQTRYENTSDSYSDKVTGTAVAYHLHFQVKMTVKFG